MNWTGGRVIDAHMRFVDVHNSIWSSNGLMDGNNFNKFDYVIMFLEMWSYNNGKFFEIKF